MVFAVWAGPGGLGDAASVGGFSGIVYLGAASWIEIVAAEAPRAVLRRTWWGGIYEHIVFELGAPERAGNGSVFAIRRRGKTERPSARPL